ncbi:MAG: ABC transporter ATP-binding protein [Nocardioidaceae bacterium]
MTSPTHPRPVVECIDVTRTYPGGVRAIRGVSLAIHPGDVTAIVGPSGSGKTTLLQLMGTLDRPTSGTVRVAGNDVATLGDRALSTLRANTIGFVFQQFHLSPLMSLRDNVAEGLLYTGTRHRERQRRAIDALRRLGLGHRLDHRPQLLSGGERQRAAIARAIIGDPAVVLADEPTGNLDTANGRTVVEILHGLASEGTAVVIITHDHEVAAAMDRRLVIRDGRLQSEAATLASPLPPTDPQD